MTIIRNKMPRVRVAAIIIENKKLLLIAHKKNKNVYWLLPGGGIDFGESLAGALTRELNEELGVSVNVNEFAWVSDSIDPAGKRHIVNICFYCSHIEGEYSLGRDKRLHDFGFFNSEELYKRQILPPYTKELSEMLNNRQSSMKYLGERWADL